MLGGVMVHQQVEGPRVVEPHQVGQRSRAVISMNVVQIAGRAFKTAGLPSPDALDQPAPARPIDASHSSNGARDRALQQQPASAALSKRPLKWPASAGESSSTHSPPDWP